VVNQLEELMNPEASFKKYRDALQAAAPPTIPFVYVITSLATRCGAMIRPHHCVSCDVVYSGVYLSDLTFMEDGNAETLEGLININKRRMVYNIIESVQQYQLVCAPSPSRCDTVSTHTTHSLSLALPPSPPDWLHL
jgi:hypothetical protein